MAEYPFATLTSQGSTIPPPISTARETSLSYPIVVAVKVLTTVFFSACLIVAAFYLSHLLRKWKLKRDHHYHMSHHAIFFGSRNGGSSSPMFDSMSMSGMMSQNENTPQAAIQGIRQALRLHKRRRGRRKSAHSPIVLPPFKSSDTICTAAGGVMAASDTWKPDICPYATFNGKDGNGQQPLEANSNGQVTIQLQHHGQLENNFAQANDTYHHHHRHHQSFVDGGNGSSVVAPVVVAAAGGGGAAAGLFSGETFKFQPQQQVSVAAASVSACIYWNKEDSAKLDATAYVRGLSRNILFTCFIISSNIATSWNVSKRTLFLLDTMKPLS